MAFWPLFRTANIFSWVETDFIKESDYKNPNPTKFSAKTLLKLNQKVLIFGDMQTILIFGDRVVGMLRSYE